MEYIVVKWDADHGSILSVEPGVSKFQTFWEFLILLLALMVCGNNFIAEQVAVLGDNTGALQNALDLKGRGILAAVARELAWRQARFGWSFAIGHVPSEKNVVPDALSRQYEYKPSPFPTAALAQAQVRASPDCKGLWRALAFGSER